MLRFNEYAYYCVLRNVLVWGYECDVVGDYIQASQQPLTDSVPWLKHEPFILNSFKESISLMVTFIFFKKWIVQLNFKLKIKLLFSCLVKSLLLKCTVLYLHTGTMMNKWALLKLALLWSEVVILFRPCDWLKQKLNINSDWILTSHSLRFGKYMYLEKKFGSRHRFWIWLLNVINVKKCA